MRRLLIGLTLAAVLASALSSPFARPSAGARVNRFDERAAWTFLRRQVELGPRPAGSAASARLAEILRASIPRGRYQTVPGGLRNVVGTVRGRNPRRVVVIGAHYDTKDLSDFVGANDGASGTAVVRQLARTIKPRQVRPTLVFVFFDGEESPPDAPPGEFERYGLRGSKVAARAFRQAEAAIVLDFVGDRDLAIPREQLPTGCSGESFGRPRVRRATPPSSLRATRASSSTTTSRFYGRVFVASRRLDHAANMRLARGVAALGPSGRSALERPEDRALPPDTLRRSRPAGNRASSTEVPRDRSRRRPSPGLSEDFRSAFGENAPSRLAPEPARLRRRREMPLDLVVRRCLPSCH